jgi:hypothetical protein
VIVPLFPALLDPARLSLATGAILNTQVNQMKESVTMKTKTKTKTTTPVVDRAPLTMTAIRVCLADADDAVLVIEDDGLEGVIYLGVAADPTVATNHIVTMSPAEARAAAAALNQFADTVDAVTVDA